MIGAIAGDIIGSPYEHKPIKTTSFPLFSPASRFTDDTVLTAAIANSILTGTPYAQSLEDFYYHYPNAGFGSGFQTWASSHDHRPYNSWGNGSAMRVSPIAFAYQSMDKVLSEAKKSAEVTHNHPEGVKGAQAIASAIFLSRSGESKQSIKNFIQNTFEYDITQPIDAIRPSYSFEISCQKSVPQAIIAFLESENYEDAIRKAISLGGDSDTLACMAGGIAEAFYHGIPCNIETKVFQLLDERLSEITKKFQQTHMIQKGNDNRP